MPFPVKSRMWQVRFHRTSARKQKSPFMVAPFTPHGGSAATVCRTAARSEPTKFPVGAQAPRESRVAPPRISQWSSDLQMKLSIRGSVLGILRSITVACKDPASSAMAAVVRRLFSSVGQLVQVCLPVDASPFHDRSQACRRHHCQRRRFPGRPGREPSLHKRQNWSSKIYEGGTRWPRALCDQRLPISCRCGELEDNLEGGGIAGCHRIRHHRVLWYSA